MTTHEAALRRARSEAGFTIIEMLISTAVMLAVTSAVFTLLNPGQGVYQTQPEVADLQQRVRVGVDTLQKDIVMAGAGTYMGASAGALMNFFTPVMPFRAGEIDSDQARGIYYRPDAITVMYVPPSNAQTGVVRTLGNNSAEIDVEPQLNCGADKKNQLCGFEIGMRVIIFDPSGAFDWMTVTNVQDAALHLQHNRDKLSGTYGPDAALTEVSTHTYYLKSDEATKTYQLRHYDGDQTDLPVVDNVVKLEFQYFGDPQPPRLLPNVCLTAECPGPWTTYGPKPPALGINRDNDTWGDGENCVFMVDQASGQHVPRLPVLGAGGNGQVELTAEMLQEGPQCPDDSKTEHWDADLLRIRRIRVNLRVQVASANLRGPAGILFAKGGDANSNYKLVPDQEIRFDVTPRNMNLGR